MCVFISVVGLTGFDFPEYSLLTGRYTSALRPITVTCFWAKIGRIIGNKVRIHRNLAFMARKEEDSGKETD